MPTPFAVSLYAHERAPIAQPKQLTEEELIALLTTHTERSIKEGPAWSPAELGPCPAPCLNAKTNRYKCGPGGNGGEPHRHEKNVLRHSLLVFDIDHKTEEEAERIFSVVQETGLKAVVHSTYSHSPPLDCSLRLILFPNRPMLAAEVKKVRAGLIAALEIPVDASTKDLSRLYYLPALPPGGPEPLVLVLEGGEVEVEPLLGYSPPAAPIEPSSPKLTGAAVGLLNAAEPVNLEDLRARLKAIDPPATKNKTEVKALLKRVLDGEPLALVGEHDTTLQRLAGILATYLPESTPFGAIAALCELSLRRMEWQDGYEDCLVAFEEKYARAVERVVAFRAERKARLDAFKTELRRKSTATTLDPLAAEVNEEDGTYSEAALEAWGIGDQEWIIQKGKTFFVFSDGRYKVRTSDELPNAIFKDLLRAPLKLEIETQKGIRDLTPPEIIQAYGSVAENVHASLVLQQSKYDARTGTFYQAVCPLRKGIEPAYDAQIQHWLELLGGPDKDKLLDWIATITRVDQQTCAIYLYGPKGIGKTTFAHGLARLWTTGGPPLLSQLFTDFNDAIGKCPVIFADEKLPERKNINAEMRELIGTNVRPLKRKFMDSASLEGALRLIIAANKPDLLKQSEDMTDLEVEATAERFLFIEATGEATSYLENVVTRDVANTWRTEDKLAKHALWLKENRVVKPSGRFLVTGKKKKFHDSLAINSSVAKQVCEVLVKQLLTTRPPSPAFKDLLIYGHGMLLVNVRAIEIIWEDHIKTNERYGIDRLAKALGAISLEAKTVKFNNKQIRFARIRVEPLYEWAAESGLADKEELQAVIDRQDASVALIAARYGWPMVNCASKEGAA